MSNPSSTPLEDRLDQQLRLLADQLDVPATDPDADLRRGRRRHRRVRTGAVAGTAATVAAVSAAGFSTGGQLAADDAPVPDRTTPATHDAPAAAPGAALPEVEVRDVRPGALTDALAAGAGLAAGDDRTDRFLAMAARIDTEVGDQAWREVGLGEVESWSGAGVDDCPAGWTCEDVDVEGATRAALATRRGEVQAVADFGDQVLTVILGRSGLSGVPAWRG
ncbi:hypothetical protein L615_007400000070 [Nocardioides sp. J9]|uniref:hypothetical protein n=1 Tax=Nocardioides sp. J9 TaxID=935844 RepID=UPI00119DB60B|nr:hypothetical protein [Nocardioides sp. J9]TWG92043.1 hypothetical protein L615_007400000070 [Nocardioides sp. J9]